MDKSGNFSSEENKKLDIKMIHLIARQPLPAINITKSSYPTAGNTIFKNNDPMKQIQDET